MSIHYETAVQTKAEPISIWIVEDNAVFRRTLVNLIDLNSKMRCEKVFSSCKDLLASLKSGEGPTAILLDIGLPGMSGLEAINKIKLASPETEVIMLTVYDDEEIVLRSICSGASGYLLKSTPAQRLIESILDIAHGGAPISPRIARKILEMLSSPAVNREEYNLSDREKEILGLMVQGLTKKSIGEKLSISHHTVNSHVKKIYTKLRVRSRSGAIVKVFRERLI